MVPLRSLRKPGLLDGTRVGPAFAAKPTGDCDQDRAESVGEIGREPYPLIGKLRFSTPTKWSKLIKQRPVPIAVLQ